MTVSPQERLASVLTRIAYTPNIIRTRRDDALRADRNVEDFDQRVLAVVTRLEKFATELEKNVV